MAVQGIDTLTALNCFAVHPVNSSLSLPSRTILLRVFMQRHTPCASLLRSRLVVTADLRKERQRLRNG